MQQINQAEALQSDDDPDGDERRSDGSGSSAGSADNNSEVLLMQTAPNQPYPTDVQLKHGRPTKTKDARRDETGDETDHGDKTDQTSSSWSTTEASDSLAKASHLGSAANISVPAPTGGPYSLSWISDEERRFQQFVRVRYLYRQIAPNSEFVPRTWRSWLKHHAEVNEAELGRVKKLLSHKTKGIGLKVSPAFNSKSFLGGKSAILSEDTIWCQEPSTDVRVPAPWPSQAEMKWEGDDRAATGVGRFLGLPRDHGNGTVAWHMLPIIQSHAFDQVRKLPNPMSTACDGDDDDDGGACRPLHWIDADLWSKIDG
ncbi:MAG: hypothetical protein M1817_002550 [Caeruleum heppii]|nr:MAG: hypothetical protein M1817_002550 [Caeruleum heppii]